MRTTTTRGADAPIGIFDSGVGGLTVARAVLDQLPNESVRYIGDTLNGPYGPLPIAEVRRHSLAGMGALAVGGVPPPLARRHGRPGGRRREDAGRRPQLRERRLEP